MYMTGAAYTLSAELALPCGSNFIRFLHCFCRFRCCWGVLLSYFIVPYLFLSGAKAPFANSFTLAQNTYNIPSNWNATVRSIFFPQFNFTLEECCSWALQQFLKSVSLWKDDMAYVQLTNRKAHIKSKSIAQIVYNLGYIAKERHTKKMAVWNKSLWSVLYFITTVSQRW